MQIQWYPGHMTKARRAMKEDIKLVDLVIELVDARAPMSSRNPDIDALAAGKARLLLMNKSDLADDAVSRGWEAYFRRMGITVLRLDSRKSNVKKDVLKAITDACKEKIERDRKRGIKNRPIRAMVAGIPNVGKSTFINTIAGKSVAVTGNKPGVTRGNQWIRLNPQVELLDTPGILWPKFEDPDAGLRLAMLGAVSEDVIDLTELSMEILKFLADRYPTAVENRYGVSAEAGESAEKTLERICGKKSCMKQGGEPDLARMARTICEDFKNGRLGTVSLERPEGENHEG